MSLSQADLKIISTVFGKTTDEISGAISDENEVSLDLRLNGRVISQEDEKNLREGGVQQGKQIGYKEIAKSLEINLEEGEKDPKIIADKLKNTLSTSFEEKYKNLTPDGKDEEAKLKAKEWEDKYNKLFSTHEKKIKEIEEWESKYTGLVTDVKTKEKNNSILKSLPKGLKFDPDDALHLTHKYLDIKENESGVFIPVDKETGNIITNGIGEPESIENALKILAEKKEWYTRKPGMNGENRNGKASLSGGKTKDEAYKIIKEKGIPVASQEGLNMFKELTAPVA